MDVAIGSATDAAVSSVDVSDDLHVEVVEHLLRARSLRQRLLDLHYTLLHLKLNFLFVEFTYGGRGLRREGRCRDGVAKLLQTLPRLPRVELQIDRLQRVESILKEHQKYILETKVLSR